MAHRLLETFTADEAERVGFTGSPTVWIDGRDPFGTGNEQVGLACRTYPTPDGLSGSPTAEQFVSGAVVKRAVLGLLGG